MQQRQTQYISCPYIFVSICMLLARISHDIRSLRIDEGERSEGGGGEKEG